jgi:hypothetical protein
VAGPEENSFRFGRPLAQLREIYGTAAAFGGVVNAHDRLRGVNRDHRIGVAAIVNIILVPTGIVRSGEMNHAIWRYAVAPRLSLLGLFLVAMTACTSERTFMDSTKLNEFGARYTAAWCSQNAASVASFFADQGSLKINDGAPATGRTAIASSVQGFMTAFPNLVVKMDSLTVKGTEITYHWTLTNTGPGGTGKFVRISGFEEWRFGPDGLIAESKGHFDAAEYQRQLNAGPKGS